MTGEWKPWQRGIWAAIIVFATIPFAIVGLILTSFFEFLHYNVSQRIVNFLIKWGIDIVLFKTIYNPRTIIKWIKTGK